MTQQRDGVGQIGSGSTAMDRPVRQVPSWLAAAAAVAFLLAAGGFIYWFLGGNFVGTADLIPDPARAERTQGRGGPGGWRNANADGVQSLPGNRGHLVRSGSAIMDVVAAAAKKPATHAFRYDSQGLLTREQWHLALGLRRINQDGAMAKTLDVSKDQLDRLRRFSTIPMEITPADRDQVVAAWDAYQKAAGKAEPEKKLLAALKEAGNRALPATKARANQRIAEIGQVLRAEQVRELTKLGAGDPVTPIVPGAKGATPPG